MERPCCHAAGKTAIKTADGCQHDNLFSGLGDFMALPMRTFSAGMAARLAFAVSTSTRNDILLIDEGIGAGDAAFQEKARERIATLFGITPIVILASHSPDLIKRFCNRRVEMEHGRLKSLS